MKILGIETSCDETSAAVVEDGHTLLSNIVSSSMDLHRAYGGIVPEIAARSHIEVILPVIDSALSEASCVWDDIDAIAVTYGAGLGGSLLIGVTTAKALALAKSKPLYAVNHVVGHVYANFLTSSKIADYNLPKTQPQFPFLAVIVSGKHSQLAVFEDHFKYQLLGTTQDDAIGEAFDKVARMLGLRYPGGPAVSEAAKAGDQNSYSFPIAKVGKYDFSFSGLKTAVLRQAQAEIGEDHQFPSSKLAERLTSLQKANIAASFEYTAAKTIVSKVEQAVNEFSPKCLLLAGGAAANNQLRQQLTDKIGVELYMPDLKLCTDNGAMIAALGSYMRLTNQPLADPITLGIVPNLSM